MYNRVGWKKKFIELKQTTQPKTLFMLQVVNPENLGLIKKFSYRQHIDVLNNEERKISFIPHRYIYKF